MGWLIALGLFALLLGLFGSLVHSANSDGGKTDAINNNSNKSGFLDHDEQLASSTMGKTVFDDTNLHSSTDDHLSNLSQDATSDINPATGLPMISDIGGVDVGGNHYGFDNDDSMSSIDDTTSGFDFDSIDSSSSIDDPFT